MVKIGQEGYERLGDHIIRKTGVHIIAATNTDLEKAVQVRR